MLGTHQVVTALKTSGIEQRVRAINAFLYDIYHRQEILRAGRIPEALISTNDAFVLGIFDEATATRTEGWGARIGAAAAPRQQHQPRGQGQGEVPDAHD